MALECDTRAAVIIYWPQNSLLVKEILAKAPESAAKKLEGKYPLRIAFEHGASKEIIEVVEKAYAVPESEMFNSTANPVAAVRDDGDLPALSRAF